MALSSGKVHISIGVDMSKFNKGINAVGKRLKKFEKQYRKAIEGMTYLGHKLQNIGRGIMLSVTAPLALFSTMAVKESAEYEGAMDRFGVIFRGGMEEMLAWVDTFSKEFPLARSEIVGVSSALADLMIPMGINRSLAGDMTKEFMHLAGALSAFYDVPMEESVEAIKSGLAGFSRPLRRYGIDVRKEAVQQHALAMGILETGEAMTEQIRIMAMLDLAQKQSRDALDGLEEQKGSLLWKIEELKASVKDLMLQFGDLLLPIVKALTDKIKALSDWISNLTQKQKMWILIGLALVAVLGVFLFFAGTIILAISSIAMAITALGSLIVPILIGIAVLLVTVIATILAVIVAIKFWNRYGDTMKKNWTNNFEKIRETVEGVKKAFKDAMQTFWDNLSPNSKNMITKYIIMPLQMVIKTLGHLQALLQGVGLGFKFLADNWFGTYILGDWSKDPVLSELGKTGKIVNRLALAFDTLAISLAGYINLFTSLQWVIKILWNQITTFFEGVANQIVNWLNAIIIIYNDLMNRLGTESLQIDLIGKADFGIEEPSVPELNENGSIKDNDSGSNGDFNPDDFLPTSVRPNDKNADIRVYLDTNQIVEAVGVGLVDRVNIRT